MKTIWKKIMLFSGVGALSISAIAPIVSCSALKINNGNSETIDDSMIESAYLRFPGMENDLSGEHDNLGLYTSSVLSRSYLGNLLNMQKTQIERTQLKEWNDWVYNFKIPYKNNPNKFGRIAYPYLNLTEYVFLNMENLDETFKTLIIKFCEALEQFIFNIGGSLNNLITKYIDKLYQNIKFNIPNNTNDVIELKDNNIGKDLENDDVYLKLTNNANCNPEFDNMSNLDFSNVDFSTIFKIKENNFMENEYKSILFKSDMLNLESQYLFTRYIFLHFINKLIYIKGYESYNDKNMNNSFINIKRNELYEAIVELFTLNFIPAIEHILKVCLESIPMLLEIVTLTDIYNRLDRWVDTCVVEIDNTKIPVLYPAYKYIGYLLSKSKNVISTWLKNSLTWQKINIPITNAFNLIFNSLSETEKKYVNGSLTLYVKLKLDEITGTNVSVKQVDEIVSLLTTNLNIEIHIMDFLPSYKFIIYAVLIFASNITIKGKTIDRWFFDIFDSILGLLYGH